MRNQGQWTEYVKNLLKEFNKDLLEYQFSIGCIWCDCEKKMWKLQKKWDNYEKTT